MKFDGDIASTNYAGDYKITQASEDTVDKEPCYLFDLAAVDKKATYDRIKYWVSKQRIVGVKAEFYTISGKLFKSAEFKYANRVRINDKTEIPFISELLIRDTVQADKATTLDYSNIKVHDIPDSAFNINVLLK